MTGADHPQLVPLVEGQGEQLGAIAVLLRRLLHHHGEYGLVIAEPIRRPRSELAKAGELDRWVRQASRSYTGCVAVLVLLDTDDDCPKTLGPHLVAGVRAAAGVPVFVVLPNREFENWFLAGVEGLLASGDAVLSKSVPVDPERIRGAKERLARDFLVTRQYKPTADQASIAAKFDLAWAYRRSRSFRKLWKDVASLVEQLGGQPQPPPEVEAVR